jgi:glutathione S-transferase
MHDACRFAAVKVRLFTIPGSHPGWSVRLMLESKGIPYSRVDLVAVLSKPILRAMRFPGSTIPALTVDGRRIQGSRAIARELDRLVPEPPLFPADPEDGTAVEEAEAWGEEVLQDVARRLVWNLLSKDRAPIRSYLEGARLGVPVGVAAKTAAPIAKLSARLNEADDAHAIADLADLPALIDRVDGYIADGVLGCEPPNAADLQIAPSLALLMTLDDVRPFIAERPAGELARRLVPGFPGHTPPGFPASWLAPLGSAEA